MWLLQDRKLISERLQKYLVRITAQTVRRLAEAGLISCRVRKKPKLSEKKKHAWTGLYDTNISRRKFAQILSDPINVSLR